MLTSKYIGVRGGGGAGGVVKIVRIAAMIADWYGRGGRGADHRRIRMKIWMEAHAQTCAQSLRGGCA